MTSVFLLAILAYSLAILAVLFHIDLKTRLLPNRYVAQFFFSGLAFHIISGFSENPPLDLLIAAVSGAVLLLVIRGAGNKFYGQDTLGMGDVKLIAASGVWLGSKYVFLAIALGALAGVIHGLGIMIYSRLKAKEIITLRSLSIPAGPGFIVGIVFCAGVKYGAFIAGLF